MPRRIVLPEMSVPGAALFLVALGAAVATVIFPVPAALPVPVALTMVWDTV